MRFTERTVPTMATLTAATLGLGIGWAILGPTPDPRITSATPTHTQQVVLGQPETAPLQEDDPGWSCFEQGDKVCGDPGQVFAVEAWAAWDKGEGWRRLRAASTDTKVEYVGTATQSPNVDALTEVAIPGLYGDEAAWYVFRAVPAAPAMDTITAPTPINALD